MCPGAAAVGLGTHLAGTGLIAGVVAYFTATPSAFVDLLASLLDYLGDNAEERADLLYKLRAYAAANTTQVEGLVSALMTALADNGHLHSKGTDYTLAEPRVVLQFGQGSDTWFLPLYKSVS